MVLFLGVRGKLNSVPRGDLAPVTPMGMGHVGAGNPDLGAGGGLEAELARVHAMLAHNSKVYKVFIYIMHFYIL